MAAPRFGRGRSERAAIAASLFVAAIAPSCTRKATVEPPREDASLTRPMAIPIAEPPPQAAPVEAEPPTPRPTREFAACDPTRSIEKLTIVHTSDMHGHFHPYLSNGRSPFAVLRAYAERRRVETGNRALFVDAGDAIEKGSLAEIRSRGDATVALLDQLGLDARTLGNHDFAWGLESVKKQVASTAHAVLASNLAGTDAKRTVVFDVGCVRVGLFGLVINQYDETDERIDAPYLGTFAQEHDPGDADRYVGVASALARELREEHKADVVIGVNHLGIARDRAIIDSVPGIDLVVSAHDHQALNGYVQGKYGVLVATGTFVGARTDARVGDVSLEIDLKTRAVKLSSAGSARLEDLRDLDTTVQAEVERVQKTFAPDADTPIAEIDAPLGPYQLDTINQIFDGALRLKFPEASAFLYEAWTYGGIVRGELPRGPITPQMLADFAFSERQRVGGPGFTAFVPIEVTGKLLREVCAATLRENTNQRVHRVCPTTPLDDDARYTLVIERRPLHAPHLAFVTPPALVPPAAEDNAVEAMDLLIDYARARGKLCKALDKDVQTSCR